MILRDLLRVLGSNRRDGRNLTYEESYQAFATILDGPESEIQVGAFLIALRWKGVTVEELTGFARAARDRARIPCSEIQGLVCISSPHDGMDQTPPLDVASGLIAAGAGVRVLMVCERAVPPKRGLTAANVLEQLGAGLTWDPTEVEDWVLKDRFGAIAASGMLPALLGLRRVRGDIGVRTPLATVEKLVVPSNAAVVLGAQSGPVLGVAVETIANLGHPRGIVLQGMDGGVTPGLRRRSRGIELDGQHQVPVTVDPSDFGLGGESDPELPFYGPPEDGEGAADNPALVRAAGSITEAVISGDHGPARNAAILGAAVTLKAAGHCLTLAEGVDAATESLDSGRARDVLDRLRDRVKR